jgi:hypothetical protein
VPEPAVALATRPFFILGLDPLESIAVMHPRSLSALLARRAAADDRFAELAERVTAMSRATEPTVWLPRLAAFGLRDGTLDLDGPSLYFHPSPAVPREPPHRLGSDPEAWEGSEDGRR